MKAEKFSTLPWPYWWSASAGLSETRTDMRVMMAAIRSSTECSGFGKYAQAAGGYAHHNFQRGDGEGGQNGVPRDGALLRAHRLRTVDRGRTGHSGIIAVGGQRAWGAGPRLAPALFAMDLT